MSKKARVTRIEDFKPKSGIDTWELSDEQRDLRSIIRASDLTLVTGKAGVGKTAAILYTFAEIYLKDVTKNIIVIRTPVEAGIDKIGFLPGDALEKLEPHFAPAKKILEQLMGKGKVECDVGKRIHFKIPNFVLGDTFDDSLIVISEAQQMAPNMIKLLLERVGKDSIVVVEGDETQLYTTGGQRNGLTHAFDLFQKYPQPGIDFFEFSNNTNMRSDFVGRVNKVYELDS